MPATGPEGTAPPLEITLFGPFHTRMNGRALPHLRSRKGHWLLALLALRAGRSVDRAWLAGTLWPDSSDPQALANLRNTLKDLRHALGPEAGRLYSPTTRTLLLDLAGAAVDAVAFDAAIARGDLPSLERAVTLYRGPLLEGCAEEWVAEERRAREQAYLAALEALAVHARTRGDLAAAERALRQTVAVDPLRESAQRALIETLAAGGSDAAAMQVYRELRELLHRELNAEPTLETQALFHQLRSEARLRAQAPRSKPSSATVSTATHNLPHQLTRFIGREREVAEVSRLLTTHRLVTLTGAGGCGKTRLALQVAAEQVDVFPHGVFFVNLAPIRDLGLIASTIAQVLDVRESADRPLVESLKEYLREKQLLLLLDNFEQVLAAAPLVAELLASAGRLTVLVTSRAALHVRGEQEYGVPPLALPDPADRLSAEALSQCAAVTLFADRAAGVRAGFTVTPANAAAVAGICCRLDGLPLAIELAAARVKLFSPQAVLARLGSRLVLLTEGARDLPARQRTLRSAIAWSYDLLEEGEQRLFRRLSVFVGGFTLEAAAAICMDDDRRAAADDPWHPTYGGRPPVVGRREVLQEVTSLIDWSLLQALDEATEEPRFEMLETIREYALERLTKSGEAGSLARRHVDCFLHMAEEAEHGFDSTKQAAWLDHLDAEHNNLRAALAWSVEREEGREIGLRLAGSLQGFWVTRGHWREGQQWIEGALARVGGAGRTTARAKGLCGAGRLAEAQWEYEAARPLLQESAAIYRELGEKRGLAMSLRWLGWVMLHLDDAAAARALQMESVALCREIGDRWLLAGGLHSLAVAASAEEEWDRALLEESLAITREMGHRWGIAANLSALGGMAQARGDDEATRLLLQECLALRREIGYREGIARALLCLGINALDRADWGGARSFFGESLVIHRDLGLKERTAVCLEGMAWVAGAHEQPERAAQLLGAAETLCVALGRPPDWPLSVRADRAGHVATVRTALGEEAFAAAWKAGRAMTLQEAIDEALLEE